MKDITVDTYKIPSIPRSKNYTRSSTVVNVGGSNSGSSSSTPSQMSGGAADTAKIAQNLSEDSSDWDKIIRKDIDDNTSHTVDFKAGLLIATKLLAAVLNSASTDSGTDDSVYTSKRIDDIISGLSNKYLSKLYDDIVQGNIEFKKNITVDGTSTIGGNQTIGGSNTVVGDETVAGNQTVSGDSSISGNVTIGKYNPGVPSNGAKITENGNAEMRSLRLHDFLEVPELRYNRATVHTGVDWLVSGGGIIESVVVDTKTNSDGSITNLQSGVVTLHLEDGQIGAISDGAFCMGVFHNFNGSNDTENSDSHTGNFTFAGFNTVYFYIDEILDTAKNSKFHYILRETSDTWQYSNHPSPQMTFAEYANNKHTDRQSCVYSTTQYTIGLEGMNTWEFGDSNIYRLEGYIDGWTVGGKTFEGYGMVLGNCYVYGKIDTFERLKSKMTFDVKGDYLIAKGETKEVDAVIVNGYGIDITSQFTVWTLTRNTGDTAADNIWNATKAVISTSGVSSVSYSDLGEKPTLFTVTAENDSGGLTATFEM